VEEEEEEDGPINGGTEEAPTEKGAVEGAGERGESGEVDCALAGPLVGLNSAARELPLEGSASNEEERRARTDLNIPPAAPTLTPPPPPPPLPPPPPDAVLEVAAAASSASSWCLLCSVAKSRGRASRWLMRSGCAMAFVAAPSIIHEWIFFRASSWYAYSLLRLADRRNNS